MNNIRLIATDMDGTLLTSEGKLPPGFDDTIRQLQEAGIEFAAASGRPYHTLKKTFEEYGDSISYICDNGGSIFYQGEPIFESMIAPADYHTIIQEIQEHTDGIPVLCGMDSAYINQRDQAHRDAIQPFFQRLTLVDDLLALTAKAPKVTVYFPNQNSREYYDKFFAPRFSDRFAVTTSDIWWLDMMNKEVNKGNAIQRLGKKLAISPAQMMAFGDNYNDREILETVKYSYAMANAAHGVFDYAKYKTASNDEFGVLQTIQEVLDAKK